MRKKHQTPEKALLNLIEKGASPGSGVAATTQTSHAALSFSDAVVLAVKKIPIFISEDPWGVRVFLVLSICVVLIFFFSLIHMHRAYTHTSQSDHAVISYDEIGTDTVFTLPAKEQEAALQQTIDSVVNADYSIFEFKPAESNAVGEGTGDDAQRVLDRELKNLRIAGISFLDCPEVILVDKKEGQTFFLKQDETINDLVISRIDKEAVEFSYNGKTAVLR